MNKLERAYASAATRQTDFEIVGADKKNPTTLSLKPVPRTKAYNPEPALRWGIQQLDAVGKGQTPDQLVRSEIAFDLANLAERKDDYGYKAFWINGHAEAVRFDEQFRENALRVARARVIQESPQRWHRGVAQGTIVGELKKIDDLDADSEFVIVPPVGPDFVRCTFTDEMRQEIGKHVFKTVRVVGALHYSEESPFPVRVQAARIEAVAERKKTLIQMRGIFASNGRTEVEWGALLNGG